MVNFDNTKYQVLVNSLIDQREAEALRSHDPLIERVKIREFIRAMNAMSSIAIQCMTISGKQ